MPSYAKFLKEILSNKKKLKEFEIRDVSIDKALCDFGASIGLMPLSIYEKTKIGEMKPTTISLKLADRSIKFPVGVIENVPLKVGKFFIPMDFVVLEMEEDVHIPIILSTPFLATVGAVIDAKNGRLTFKVREENVKFNLFQAMKKKDDSDPCLRVDVIDELVAEVFKKQHLKDPLEACWSTTSLKGMKL
ncbi:uncharacterized protein LOC110657126 [Hevea brasiliensis]|uniref:uncharacterized protein LOC110657126 n=1 Tax=Hevea brasiliensis TaxID=3981 RepID=UPI0025F9D9E7|nr:uncharacterized protein LOC110657126 [Hevea brasiliensis]